MLMSYPNLAMKADPEDVSEVVRFPKDAIVTEVVLPDVSAVVMLLVLEDAVEAVVLPETEMEIANEADDSVGGATRSCGSRGRRGCSRGSCPQREGKRKAETVIILLKKCNLKRT